MAKFLWTHKQNNGPKPRLGHAMTFDSHRNRVVLFGGISLDNVLFNDTWEWDGENWTQITDLGPSVRGVLSMVYDSNRERTVLFGGSAGASSLGDTWEWDGENWTQVEDSGPVPRGGHAMVYDPNRNRVVLFGGDSSTDLLGDTWEWDGQLWTQQDESGPSARRGHGMAYENTTKRVILFGGQDRAAGFGDTWSWDGSIWTQISSIGPGPSANMATVFALDRVILYGGMPFINDLPTKTLSGNTWDWDGKHWTHRQVFGPGPRRGHTMAYDSSRQCIVLFGGTSVLSLNADPAFADRLLGDTWEHSVTPSAVEIENPGPLSSLSLIPGTLSIPGVAGGVDPQPLQVVCFIQLTLVVNQTLFGIITANLPVLVFREFSIPFGMLDVAVNLEIPGNTAPGTYRVDATLDGQTRSALLTISAAP